MATEVDSDMQEVCYLKSRYRYHNFIQLLLFPTDNSRQNLARALTDYFEELKSVRMAALDNNVTRRILSR